MHLPLAQITRSARPIEDAPRRLHRPGQVAWSRSAALLIAVALTVLAGQTGQGQSPPSPGPLKFFKNFFVTGDYLAAGVGLEGLGNSATGLAGEWIDLGTPGDPLNPPLLPAADSGAEVLAAFLYWQVISSDGPDAGALTATFNSKPLSSPDLTPQLTTPHGPVAVVDPAG